MTRHRETYIGSSGALLAAICATIWFSACADNAADAVMLRAPKKSPAPERSFLLDVAPVKEVKTEEPKAEAAKPLPVPPAPKVEEAKPTPVAPAPKVEEPKKENAAAENGMPPAIVADAPVVPVEKKADAQDPKKDSKDAKKKAKKKDKAAKDKAPARDAIITADRTDYDRKEGVVLFDRNVHVDDEQYQMHADRLFLFLEGTNELKRLVAIGHVAITNEDKRAYCARATFNKKMGRVVMYSSDEITAELREEGKKGSDVKGEKITFWLDSEQVEVENPVITMPGGIGGQGSMKKLIGK